eukprot:COSAG06_NODE_2134_length_7517_cov_52.273928_5_plen_122_part_00
MHQSDGDNTTMETHRRDIEAGQSGPQHMPTRAVPPQSIIGDPNEPYQQNKYREVRRHNASAVQYQYSTVHAAQQCTVVPSSVAECTAASPEYGVSVDVRKAPQQSGTASRRRSRHERAAVS